MALGVRGRRQSGKEGEGTREKEMRSAHRKQENKGIALPWVISVRSLFSPPPLPCPYGEGRQRAPDRALPAAGPTCALPNGGAREPWGGDGDGERLARRFLGDGGVAASPATTAAVAAATRPVCAAPGGLRVAASVGSSGAGGDGGGAVGLSACGANTSAAAAAAAARRGECAAVLVAGERPPGEET